jgi:hypothetical protein
MKFFILKMAYFSLFQNVFTYLLFIRYINFTHGLCLKVKTHTYKVISLIIIKLFFIVKNNMFFPKFDI